jgi:hypothetical protein
MKIVNYE